MEKKGLTKVYGLTAIIYDVGNLANVKKLVKKKDQIPLLTYAG